MSQNNDNNAARDQQHETQRTKRAFFATQTKQGLKKRVMDPPPRAAAAKPEVASSTLHLPLKPFTDITSCREHHHCSSLPSCAPWRAVSRVGRPRWRRRGQLLPSQTKMRRRIGKDREGPMVSIASSPATHLMSSAGGAPSCNRPRLKI